MSNFDIVFSKLMARIEDLERVVNQQDRRLNEMFREGEILEAYEDGTYEAKFYGDESKTKRIEHPQQAGEISDWVPYSKGQRVLLINPSGEPGKGFIVPAGYTEQYDQPHDQLGQAMRRNGAASDLMTKRLRRIVSKRIDLIGDVYVQGRIHVTKGIHDNGGVTSTRGVWPPVPVGVPPLGPGTP